MSCPNCSASKKGPVANMSTPATRTYMKTTPWGGTPRKVTHASQPGKQNSGMYAAAESDGKKGGKDRF